MASRAAFGCPGADGTSGAPHQVWKSIKKIGSATNPRPGICGHSQQNKNRYNRPCMTCEPRETSLMT